MRYIGGYGRMSWVGGEEWAAARARPMAPHARGILEHMNADHGEAMVAYCRAFSRARAPTSAVMTGVDRYGFEMSAATRRAGAPVRLAFAEPVGSPDEARRALVEMVARARRA